MLSLLERDTRVGKVLLSDEKEQLVKNDQTPTPNPLKREQDFVGVRIYLEYAHPESPLQKTGRKGSVRQFVVENRYRPESILSKEGEEVLIILSQLYLRTQVLRKNGETVLISQERERGKGSLFHKDGHETQVSQMTERDLRIPKPLFLGSSPPRNTVRVSPPTRCGPKRTVNIQKQTDSS